MSGKRLTREWRSFGKSWNPPSGVLWPTVQPYPDEVTGHRSVHEKKRGNYILGNNVDIRWYRGFDIKLGERIGKYYEPPRGVACPYVTYLYPLPKVTGGEYVS